MYACGQGAAQGFQSGYKYSSSLLYRAGAPYLSNPALARVKKKLIRSDRVVARPDHCLSLTFPTKVLNDSLGRIGSLKRTSDKSLFPMALGSCGHRITHFHSCVGFPSSLPPRIAAGLMPIGTCSRQDRHQRTVRPFRLLRFGTIPAGGFRLVDGLSGQPSLLLGVRMHEPKCYNIHPMRP